MPGVGCPPLVRSSATRPRTPMAASLFSRAMLSLGMITWARSLVMREISWATHTKIKVLTRMLREGIPGIRTRIPLVSAANQMWYWHMNSWGRQSTRSKVGRSLPGDKGHTGPGGPAHLQGDLPEPREEGAVNGADVAGNVPDEDEGQDLRSKKPRGDFSGVCRLDRRRREPERLFTCTTEMYGCISLHSVLFLQLPAQIE